MNGTMAAIGTVASIAFPPAAPIIGAAAAVCDALGIGEWLTKHLFGSSGEAVAQAVVTATQAVTGGGADKAAIIGLDPEKAAALRVQLATIAAQQADAERAAAQAARDSETRRIEAAIADTASARAQTIQLATMGSKLAYGAVLVSAIVLLAFGGVMYLTLTRSIPPGSESVLNVLLGTLATMAVSVVSYWVGSSAGSARKDDALANSVPVQAMQGGGSAARPLAR